MTVTLTARLLAITLGVVVMEHWDFTFYKFKTLAGIEPGNLVSQKGDSTH